MKKQNKEKIPDIEKENWKAEELVEESSNADAEEIIGQLCQDEDKENEETEKSETGGCKG